MIINKFQNIITYNSVKGLAVMYSYEARAEVGKIII